MGKKEKNNIMNYLWVRKVKLFFLFALFFQVLSLSLPAGRQAVVLAQTDSSATQTEKPSSPAEVQKALAGAGFYKGTIDGIIGAKTRVAIRSFQEENGLTVDGLVGPKTWEKLKTYLEETKGTNEEKQLTQPAAEETTPDYNLTVEPEPQPAAADDDLKQKLVS